MKINVDSDLCAGQGMCVVAASEVYTLDDNGFNSKVGQGEFEVVSGQEEAARIGAMNCPEKAIEIIEG